MFQASKSKTRAAQNQPRATAPHRMTWTFAMPGRPERGGVHGDPCAGSARVFCARTALFSRRCFVAMFSVVSPTSRPSCAQHGADCCEPPRPPRGKRAVNTPRHPKLSCRSVQRIEPSRHALRGAKPRRRSRAGKAMPVPADVARLSLTSKRVPSPRQKSAGPVAHAGLTSSRRAVHPGTRS